MLDVLDSLKSVKVIGSLVRKMNLRIYLFMQSDSQEWKSIYSRK